MDKLNQALDNWLSAYPHSDHALDERRFYEVAYAAAELEEPLDSGWLHERLQERETSLREDQVDKYTRLFGILVDYTRYKRGQL